MALNFEEYEKNIIEFNKNKKQEQENITNKLLNDKVFEKDLNYRFMRAAESGVDFIVMSVDNFPEYLRDYFKKNTSIKSREVLESFAKSENLRLFDFTFSNSEYMLCTVSISWKLV